MTAATTPDERWRLGYRPALDGLRGVAVLLVLISHARLFGMGGAGQVGVTLFFVLSGFLITSLLIEERERTGRINLGAFYRRRARRLLPALLAVLAVAAVFVGWLVVLPLVYVSNWAIVVGTDLDILSHTWSLSVEEHFYAIWPLAFIAIRRTPIAVGLLAAVFVGAWLVRLVSGELHAMWGTDARADALAIGCLLAYWFAHRPVRVPALAAVGATVVLAAVSTTADRGFLTSIGLTLIAVAGAVLVAFAASRRNPLLSSRALGWTGQVSYGLYLWHPLVFALPVGLLGIPASFVVAAASHRWIESPFLRSRGRERDERRASVGDAAGRRRRAHRGPVA